MANPSPQIPLKSIKSKGASKKEEKKEKRIMIYLVEREYQIISAKAKDLGISLSDFLRLKGLGKLSD
ncbi:hypothetical protein [Helicobacter sp. 13S00477-4]|uniref:plasmid mobilization protein n=1 Tax=Helicobacter sp. 13S00477-4 TaxID=1905759 RepID=UPI000BA73AE7|nr:hypothetical protein [Helicobacter sp. 13S00477-4]PAF52007.1 hypothetical protein BKH44_04935 [Helicobacter sp. 13S00477-4]